MSLRLAIHTVFVLVVKRGCSKIDQESILYSSRVKIVHKLSLVAGIDSRYGLQFHNSIILLILLILSKNIFLLTVTITCCYLHTGMKRRSTFFPFSGSFS